MRNTAKVGRILEADARNERTVGKPGKVRAVRMRKYSIDYLPSGNVDTYVTSLPGTGLPLEKPMMRTL